MVFKSIFGQNFHSLPSLCFIIFRDFKNKIFNGKFVKRHNSSSKARGISLRYYSIRDRFPLNDIYTISRAGRTLTKSDFQIYIRIFVHIMKYSHNIPMIVKIGLECNIFNSCDFLYDVFYFDKKRLF